ncbi:MAG: hypothetical protein HAW60_05210 [Bdellovibrionales bacterium]|nr:hypothetical protein [Bdellovibrionales bacterium]
MQLINNDGFLNLDLINDQESFDFKENDLAHTPLVKELKDNSSFKNFDIKICITKVGDSSFTLSASNTGDLQNTCGRCIRDFNNNITINFKEILLFTKKSSRSKKQESNNKDKLNDKNLSDKQHYNLGSESDTFVQEITSYKFNITKWLYENIIIAISEKSSICKKTDCDSVFQTLIQNTNTNYKSKQAFNKKGTHKIFADLLKPLKKH